MANYGTNKQETAFVADGLGVKAMVARELVTFDWALKRLLRSKANFAVLEGFLSDLMMQLLLAKGVPEADIRTLSDQQGTMRL